MAGKPACAPKLAHHSFVNKVLLEHCYAVPFIDGPYLLLVYNRKPSSCDGGCMVHKP